MRYREREGYLLNGVPRTHMRALAKLANQQNTSLTNITGTLLAQCLGIEFQASARPRKGANRDAKTIFLKLPPDLLEWIRAEAARRSVTMRTVILDCLSVSLGLKAPGPTHVAPDRRPGRPKEK